MKLFCFRKKKKFQCIRVNGTDLCLLLIAPLIISTWKMAIFTILTTAHTKKLLQTICCRENKSYSFNELHVENALKSFKLGGR